MSDLTQRDSELVALAAAMGSNCTPCIEYHIPKAREAGLSDFEIIAAIRLADKVRQVPARKTLQKAWEILPPAKAGAKNADASSDRGRATAQNAIGGTSTRMPSAGMMEGMMSKMMAGCSCPDHAADEATTPDAAASEGCGCD